MKPRASCLRVRQLRGVVALLLLGGVLALPFGCTAALGLEGREDVIVSLCQCAEQLPSFKDCRQLLGDRLTFAAPDIRAAWLAFYADHCVDSCAEAYDCYAQAGTCSQLSCSDHDECCGFATDDDEGMYCDTGAAAPSCRPCSNAACINDEDCCSFLTGQRGVGACNDQGMCQDP